jgi:hypothetical protein
MRKLLTFIALFAAFTASAQHGYIQCTGTVILYSGSIERYGSPDIYVNAQYNTLGSTWTATIFIGGTGATTDFIKTYQYEYPQATIDALTPVGATVTQQAQNVILQQVKITLLALNGGTTFTIL